MRAIRAGYAVILLLVAALYAGAETTEIVFVNRTGATIYFLYASPSSSDTWGEDLLGRTVLADGERYRARVRSAASSYDIRAVDANDNEYIIWGWAPPNDARVTVSADAFVGRQSAAASEAHSWVTIVNDTNYAIREIQLIPDVAGGRDEREQVLAEGEVVHYGESYRVDVDVDRYGTYVYDIVLIDEEGDRYVKRDVNLELTTQIVYSLSDLEWR